MVTDVRDRAAARPQPAFAADVPMRPASFRLGDTGALAGSAAAAIAMSWLIYFRLAPTASIPWFAITAFVLFLGVYWFVVRELDGPVLAGDRVMTAVTASAALAMVVPLMLILGYVVKQGYHALTWHFFTDTQEFSIGPLAPATAGGAAHAIVGTLEQVGLAVVMSVPLGFMCAIFLNEIGGRLGRPVRVFVDAMRGVPTIVAGLFVYAVWVSQFGFSGFAASLAISISMLPIVTRTSEEVLRLVPDGLREASLALGISEWRTVWGVVLPTARSGLITSVILGVARAVGETAPLIATAFGSALMNSDPFHGPQAALPLFIFKLITQSPSPNVQQRAWAGALVLMLVVLALFTLARLVGGRTRSVRVPRAVQDASSRGDR